MKKQLRCATLRIEKKLRDLDNEYITITDLPGLSCKQKMTLKQMFDDLQEAGGNNSVIPDHGVDGLLLDQMYEFFWTKADH